MKKEQTRRKVKIKGTQEYINANTGEVVPMQVITVEERDANFHKLWLSHIVQSFELLGNQKIRLAFWLIENMNRDNLLVMTQRKIAEKSGICFTTVNETFKILIESGFLVKINSGAYQINPDIIFKGGKSDRLNVVYQYSEIKQNQK